MSLRLIFVIAFICASTCIGLFLAIIDRSLRLNYAYTKFFAKWVLKFSNLKLTLSGLENIEKDKAYVFVSNHASNYDIPVMQFAIPIKTRLVFKKELGRIPIFGWQLLLGPYISIDRRNPENAVKSIHRAKEIMEKKKESVLLFAEGTRSKTGEVQPFKRGAFYLAARVGKEIIPVSISGTSKIMPKGKLILVHGDIHVHFDKPIQVKNGTDRKTEIELMEKVRDIVIANKRD